jgi:hypothetical protein
MEEYMKTLKIIILITIINFFFKLGNQMSLPTLRPIEYIGTLSFNLAIAALTSRPIVAFN